MPGFSALALLALGFAWAGGARAESAPALGELFRVPIEGGSLAVRELIQHPEKLPELPAIALFPGGGSTFHGWRWLAEELARDHAVYLVHPRGFGRAELGERSIVEGHPRVYDPKYMIGIDAPAVVDAIQERLLARARASGATSAARPRIALLGTSIGGVIVRSYAAGMRLVPDSSQSSGWRLVRDPNTAAERARTKISRLISGAWVTPRWVLDPAHFDDDELAHLSRLGSADVEPATIQAVHGWVHRSFETLEGESLRGVGESIRAPTLLIAGERSPILGEIRREASGPNDC